MVDNKIDKLFDLVEIICNIDERNSQNINAIDNVITHLCEQGHITISKILEEYSVIVYGEADGE